MVDSNRPPLMGSLSSSATRIEQSDLQYSMANVKETKGEGSPAESESPNEDGSIEEPAKLGFFAKHGKKLVYAAIALIMTGSVSEFYVAARS